MAGFRFVKNIKPREFTYESRYYDADKDELERRLAGVKGSQGKDIDAVKLRIADGLHRTQNVNKEWKSKLTKQSNYRLLLVLMVLMLIILVLFFFYYPILLQISQ